jgi:tetratricopeptide (TPR) repeat protein
MRLNISKSGVGISAGVRGMRISAGPRGTHINVGIPGTGLSYRKKLSSKKSSQSGSKKSRTATVRSVALPELPSPGFFAPRHEKDLAKAIEDYRAGQEDEALEHFLDAAPKEAGAAILAAAILTEKDRTDYKAIELLESVVQSDDEFPTPLMEEYLAAATIDIDITPNVTVAVSIDGLAATLLLVELYQAQRRVREAIGLLEEIEELAGEPVLTLSLCELYASREVWKGIINRAKNTESVDDVTLETLIFYGRAMQEINMHEAAASVFTKALRRKKNRSPILLNEARYWRAISYQEQGKHRQAHKEFQMVYAEEPDFRDVAQRLVDLSR